jgi:hypothetical protein
VHSNPGYLFNVGALSEVFRARFCEGLQGLHAAGRLQFHGQLAPLAVRSQFQALVRRACAKGWVVYSKRPFAGPQQVLTYLSRYTHRVGLSNRRLLHLDRAAETITFDYKDYADGARHKSMRLDLPEFLRRLCLHFLPPRFVKIRHFGFLANRRRQERLTLARRLLAAEPAPGPPVPMIQLPPPAEPRPWPVCPHCGWATLILVRVFPPQRFQGAVSITDSS